MITDLFPKTGKSKKQQLLEWMKEKHWVKTSDVVAWGLQNRHIRAERDARDFAEQGLLKRMDKDEKILRFGNIKDDIWIYIGG